MRYSSLLAASGLLASGLAMAAPAQAAAPAEAEAPMAGTCSVSVPARIVVNIQERNYTAHLGNDCVQAGVRKAQWKGYTPNAADWERVTFGLDADTAELNYRANSDPLGRNEWRHGYVQNAEGDDLPVTQTTSVTWIKLGSWAATSATRNGSKVTVNARAVRYWVSGKKYIPWTNKFAVLQWKTPGTSTWHNLKNVTLNSSGKASYTYTVSASRDYRVYVTATPFIWEYASAAYRR